MVCGVCMSGVGMGLLRVVPLFASWFAISLPMILICALTFCIVMLCLIERIWYTMAKMNSLSGCVGMMGVVCDY